MTDIVKQALKNLLVRRAELAKRIHAASLEPASFTIQGSVAATNRSLEELRRELGAIDAQIEQLLTGSSSSIRRLYPNYNK